MEKYTRAVRVSEYVDVEFPPLAREDVIAKQIAAIDRAREQVVEDFAKRLAGIDRMKAELLALPASEERELEEVGA